MKTNTAHYLAEIARISDLERAAGREPSALVTNTAAAITKGDALKAHANALADLSAKTTDVRGRALVMLACHATHAERFARTNKAQFQAESERDADAEIRIYANLSI